MPCRRHRGRTGCMPLSPSPGTDRCCSKWITWFIDSSHTDLLLLLFWTFAGWPGAVTGKLDLMSLPDCHYSGTIAQVISLSGLISQRNGLEARVLSGGRFTITPVKKWMNLKWLYPKWERLQENGPEEKQLVDTEDTRSDREDLTCSDTLLPLINLWKD